MDDFLCVVVQLVRFYAVLHLAFTAPPHNEIEPLIQEVHGDSGYFLSPNYPQKYPDNQNLTYTAHLTTQGPLILHIRFDIDLESTGNTCYDYVKIYSTKYCGSGTATREVRVNGTQFVMIFYSDERIEKTGFNVSFSVLEVIPTVQASTISFEELTALSVFDLSTADSATSDSSSAFSVTWGDLGDDESTDLDTDFTEKTTSSVTEPLPDKTSTSGSVAVTPFDFGELTIAEGLTGVTTSEEKSPQPATDGQQDGEADDDDSTLVIHLTHMPTTGLYNEETSPSTDDFTTEEQQTQGTTTPQEDDTEFTTDGQSQNETTASQNVDEHTSSSHSTNGTTLAQGITGSTTQPAAGTGVVQDFTTFISVTQQLTVQTTTNSHHHTDTATTEEPAAESTLGQITSDVTAGQQSQSTTHQDLSETSTDVQHSEESTTVSETTEQRITTVGQQTAQTTVHQGTTQASQPTQQTASESLVTGPSTSGQISEETSVVRDAAESTTTDTASDGSLSTSPQPSGGASVADNNVIQSGVTATLNTKRTIVRTPSQTPAINDTTTSTVRPPTLSLPQKSCRCVPVITRAKKPAVMQQTRDDMAELVKSLIVKKDNTSATRRRLVSASDGRSSSKVMGAVGIVLCVLPLLLMLLTDILGFSTRHQDHSGNVYVQHQN